MRVAEWGSIGTCLVSAFLKWDESGADGRTGLRKLVKVGENAELLKDPLLARSSTWNMSTSQIYIRHAPAYGESPLNRRTRLKLTTRTQDGDLLRRKATVVRPSLSPSLPR
mgnify:FL=1